jgi:hypothetical protein
MELAEIAAHVTGIGEMAIEMIGYLVDTRFKVFDSIEFSKEGDLVTGEGGKVRSKPLRRSPWSFWMRSDDLSEEDLELLAGRGIRMDNL